MAARGVLAATPAVSRCSIIGVGGSPSTELRTGPRIRFLEIDVKQTVLCGADAERGFPLPPGLHGWVPFQIESSPAPMGDNRVRLSIWLREGDS